MGLLVDFLRWMPIYFFPKTCVECGKEGWWVCPECRPTVQGVFDRPICPECVHPSALGTTHPGCKRRYGLDGLSSFYHYDGWAKLMMRRAKFQSPPQQRPLQDLSSEFAPLLASRLHQVLGVRLFEPEGSAEPERPEDSAPSTVKSSGLNSPRGTRHQPLVIPVPLHWWRERKRGYNQAALIARALGSALRLPINPTVVARTQYTRPQTLLAVSPDSPTSLSVSHRIKELAEERKKNVRGAFLIRNETAVPRTILLVDDVWTSGATMTECCKTLKHAGARWVWGVTLFRA